MKTSSYRIVLSTLTLIAATTPALLISACASSNQTADSSVYQLQESESLKNVFQLNDSLYSGSEPVNRAAFEELEAMGIRTLISVDATPPNAALAGEHNIRVIHLPIGYEGISDQRVKELAFAIQSSFKPVYIHCHLGKHRGPAATCAGALALGEITHEEADAFMTQAGTSKNYSGLWSAVEHTQQLETIEPMHLSEQAIASSLSKTMSRIAKQATYLNDIADNGFAPLADHPDLTPTSIAGHIHNLLRSLETNEEALEYGSEFMEDLEYASQAASKVETLLQNNELDLVVDAMSALENSCSRCHDKL